MHNEIIFKNMFISICILPGYYLFMSFAIFFSNLKELFFNTKMIALSFCHNCHRPFFSDCHWSFILDVWKFYIIKFIILILHDVFFYLVSPCLFKNYFFGPWWWIITWLLHPFPITAVTNCPRICELKQYKFIILPFWGSEVQRESHWIKNQVVGRATHHLDALEGKLFPCLSSFRRLPASLACGLFLCHQSSSL